jgi:hypothetical protein
VTTNLAASAGSPVSGMPTTPAIRVTPRSSSTSTVASRPTEQVSPCWCAPPLIFSSPDEHPTGQQ